MRKPSHSVSWIVKIKMDKRSKRKVLTLEAKLQIVKLLEKGEKISVISKRHGMNESSIRRIKSNAEKIKSSIVTSTSLSTKTIKKPRNPILEKTEKVLSFWIEDQNQKGVPLSTAVIRTKAIAIFKSLQKEEPGPSNLAEVQFQASKGWFERFKQRQNLHNIKFTGQAASADTVAASLYPKTLKDIVDAGGYLTSQVFNADETGIYWKRMPNRTFISKEEKTVPGFKVSKERLTLLLSGNAAGDCKNKPLLIHTSENPRALKGISKKSLPVHWMSNKKAWMTAKIFENWFLNCFCVEAETYCRHKNISFKILLIVDNATSHPPYLAELHPNVKVVFLPPNTTSLIQPMDQGIIAAFKLYYLRRTFCELIEATDGPNKHSIREFWAKYYNILSAVKNIKLAWDEVKPSTMNAVWKKLWPESCAREAVVEIPEVMEIATLGRTLGGEGFEDLQCEDITEVLASNEENMNDDDILTHFGENNSDGKDEDEDNEEVIEKKMTSQKLATFLKLASELEQKALNMDPDMERALKFRRLLNAALAPYAEIYKDKQKSACKQLLLTNFFQEQEPQRSISSSSSSD